MHKLHVVGAQKHAVIFAGCSSRGDPSRWPDPGEGWRLYVHRLKASNWHLQELVCAKHFFIFLQDLGNCSNDVPPFSPVTNWYWFVRPIGGCRSRTAVGQTLQGMRSVLTGRCHANSFMLMPALGIGQPHISWWLGDMNVSRCKPQGQLSLLVGSRCPGFDQTPDLSSLSGSVNGCFWNLFYILIISYYIYISIVYTFNITKVEKTFGDDGWLSHCLGDKLFWLHGRFW